MAVAEVLNLDGKATGQVELADAVFAARVNQYLLHEAVRWYLAGQRAGTHKTKGRGEVSGSGRKLWKQKGTGRARVGSIRSSIWRKGGTVHGPQPRSYAYALPRKMVVGALRSALSAKFADQKLTVVEDWTLGSHKSKEFRKVLSLLDGGRTVLVVHEAGNHNLELASRNLEGVKVVAPSALQPYDLLRHERIMLSKETALRLGRSLSGMGAAPGEASGEVTMEATTEAAPVKAPAKAAGTAKAATRKSAPAAEKPKAARKPKAAKAPGVKDKE